MNNLTSPYTLGLDIGIASVGAALLDVQNERVITLHVRTFDKAEVAKTGESLNKVRREARSLRKRIRRRAQRMKKLVKLMYLQGIIERASPTVFWDASISPWQYRAAGLDALLPPKAWASVLYHIVKHRGFLSTRKSERSTNTEVGQMLASIEANQQRLKEKGYRTVGEMAHKDEEFQSAKRNKGGGYKHTFNRLDLADELRLLFAQQRNLGNPYATAPIEIEVHDLLMRQAPAMTYAQMAKLVGKCTFEPDEYRAPRASYRAERFIWLAKLNNLRIIGLGSSRALTSEERFKLMELPFSLSKLTYKQVRSRLQLPAHERFNGLIYKLDKDPEGETLFEAKAFHKFAKAYADAGLQREWQRDSQDANRLDALAHAQTWYKDDDEARAWLLQQNIEPVIVEAALGVSFSTFGALSLKALTHILPFMEQGQRYDEAVQSAGYRHHSYKIHAAEKHSYLPMPNRDLIRNPVVFRALNQARKLVNAIIKQYGPPSQINIELARDLSKSFEERTEIRKEQDKFQKEKQKAQQKFYDAFGTTPNGLDLQKMRLYHEQNGQCAYSQRPIALLQLLEPGYVEVDHILPYSRSYDDSMNNKALVLAAENRNKGNRTPYEFLDGANNSPQWQRFVHWVQATKEIRMAKRNRLFRSDFGADQAQKFRDRNLNDTRYICREFKTMIETYLQWHPHAGSGDRCVVLAGQLTALLRARWGLIKNREESDLHHAIDAAVVAAANASLVKRMAVYARRNELGLVNERYTDPDTGEIVDGTVALRYEKDFPVPWTHFRTAVLSQLADVRVSRAATRRSLGQAHEETIRSIGKEGRLLEQHKSAVKTPLSKLKIKDLPNILGADRDVRLIEAIRDRLEAYGGDGAKAFATPLRKPSAEGKEAPVIRSVKLVNGSQKSGILVRNGIADNGDMLRIDVFQKGKHFFAVPVYASDAGTAALPNRAAVANKPESDWIEINDSYRFLFSLYKNDWVVLRYKTGEVREGYYAGFNRATAAIDLWAHDRNQAVGRQGKIESCGIKTAQGFEKHHVDMLGGLHPALPEARQPIRLSHKHRGES
ncbi:MAG: type II CRISPR RNA-guided endonuclease Cas9 [Anaerolineae bacterium]|nr:type II CRISPR RNA-guided endonuclease Cas9 [Anaerolineae bacterium]